MPEEKREARGEGVSPAAEGYIDSGMFSFRTDKIEPGYLTHLEELRNRLLWCLLAVVAGVAAAWFLARPAYDILSGVVVDSVRDSGGLIITLHPAEFFVTQMKIAGVLGVILASPFVLWQLWAFIRPGLTAWERKVVAPVLPAVGGLFLFGAGVAWLMLPAIMRFFLSYSTTFDMARVTVSFEQTIDFPLKIMLAFGIAFQLPVVLLGLVWLRILTPQTLLRQWRPALVILAVIAAVVTPTGDLLTMTCMLVPLLLLYFGTVWLAMRVQRSYADRERMEDGA
ncbi:MAG: twin-arginine translocase subunit TatC [Armatimonadota bacterium]